LSAIDKEHLTIPARIAATTGYTARPDSTCNFDLLWARRKPGGVTCVELYKNWGSNAHSRAKFPRVERLVHMSNYKKEISASSGPPPLLDELAPPFNPAPMPSQTIVFWTPRVAAKAVARALIELCRPQRATRPVVVTMTMPNTDEPG
jgi:hypothetical protein